MHAASDAGQTPVSSDPVQRVILHDKTEVLVGEQRVEVATLQQRRAGPGLYHHGRVYGDVDSNLKIRPTTTNERNSGGIFNIVETGCT